MANKYGMNNDPRAVLPLMQVGSIAPGYDEETGDAGAYDVAPKIGPTQQASFVTKIGRPGQRADLPTTPAPSGLPSAMNPKAMQGPVMTNSQARMNREAQAAAGYDQKLKDNGSLLSKFVQAGQNARHDQSAVTQGKLDALARASAEADRMREAEDQKAMVQQISRGAGEDAVQAKLASNQKAIDDAIAAAKAGGNVGGLFAGQDEGTEFQKPTWGYPGGPNGRGY